MFQRLIVILVVGSALLMPAFAFAQTCTCFCGIADAGAIPFTEKMSPTDCQEQCSGVDGVMVACATDAAQFPTKNPRCFDELTCKNQTGKLDTNYQPTECIPGQHYCYPAEVTSVKLAVSIGNLGSVTNMAEYLQALYSYGLGIATTIAIVFVMVGGLQYVLAAGSGDTTKAKARIRGAVIGLLLLLFAYVILYTVNPQLVRLNVPKLPMVKRVEFVGGSQSCDYLLGYYAGGYKANETYLESPFVGKPYTIDDKSDTAVIGENGPYSCGSISLVVEDVDGNAVTEGTTCQYEGCPGNGQRCVGFGKEAVCVSCTDVYSGYGLLGSGSTLAPSSDVCKKLTPMPTGGAGDDTRNYCFYTHDPGVLVSGWAWIPMVDAFISFKQLAEQFNWSEETTDLVSSGACAAMEIDCNSIDSCADYNTINVRTHITNNELKDLGSEEFYAGDETLKTICSANPCRDDKKPGLSSCHWVDYLGSDACEPKVENFEPQLEPRGPRY